MADTGETGKGGEIRQRNRGETGQLDVLWLLLLRVRRTQTSREMYIKGQKSAKSALRLFTTKSRQQYATLFLIRL